VCISASNALAQSYAEEALIISRVRTGGTARIQGMGGVQNSLGGDISSAYYNPAGLGMYNRSDFSFTPGYNVTNYSSDYLGTTKSESKPNLMIANLGAAFHAGQDGSKGIWGGTLGISFNRVNNFNETFSYAGTNPDNSIIDYFIQDANGAATTQFNSSGSNYNTPTGLAYYNFLIGPQDILSPPGPSDQYFTDATGIPVQTETVKTSGAQNQWNLSYGVNFNDKIFVGAGLGIATLTYKSEKTYTESFAEAGQPMKQMQLNEALSLDGTGINATVGVILRPMSTMQLGFSVATPTAYEIDDSYHATMSSSWDNFIYGPGDTLNNVTASTDDVVSTYSLTTPWRLSLGLTYFFQKQGFLSADVEWLNYGATKYEGDGDYSPDNNTIKGLYKSTFNVRLGGEYRLKNYRFRAGYNLMPDPFQTPENGISRAISSYSIGTGYRREKFYIDLAVVLTSGDTSYRPYQLYYPLDPLVKQSRKATTVMITIGFPF
jgi:hypothetical protein